MSQAPQQSPKITAGPLHAVPCPHCGHKGDYRQLKELGGGQSFGRNVRMYRGQDGKLDASAEGVSTGMLETGNQVSCDKCGRVSVIVAIQTVTVMKLRQTGGRRPVDQQAAAQARAVQRRPGAAGGGIFRRR